LPTTTLHTCQTLRTPRDARFLPARYPSPDPNYNPNPNPNSNSNPNSRGQRGRNQCVRGVIKGKVSLSAHVLPTHRELTRTPRFLLHTQSVYHSLVQTDHQHSLTTCLLNKKNAETLNLIDAKSIHNRVSKYSHEPLYRLANTSQSNNSHTVNLYPS